jgi:hypothetical protein
MSFLDAYQQPAPQGTAPPAAEAPPPVEEPAPPPAPESGLTATLDTYQQPAPQQQQAPSPGTATYQTDASTSGGDYSSTPGQPQAAPLPPSPSAAVHQNETYPDTRPWHEQVGDQLGQIPSDLGRVKDQVIPSLAADAGKAVEEFKAQPSLKDKAGQVLGVFNIPQQKMQERIDQRLIDEARYGDPDATLGGMGLDEGIPGVIADPSTLKDLPAAIGEVAARPEVLLDSMPMDVADSPGGMDRGKQSYEDWAKEDPERFEAAIAKGEGYANQQWMEETGRTLESGGLGGALSGLGYGAGTDPLSQIAPAGSAATSVARGAALAAGKPGLAKGITTGGKVLQGIIDPTDIVAEPALRKALDTVTRGATSLTDAAQQERVVGQMDEAIGTTTRALRAEGLQNQSVPQTAPVVQTAAPASAAPAANGVTPPITPSVGQNGAAIAPQPNTGRFEVQQVYADPITQSGTAYEVVERSLAPGGAGNIYTNRGTFATPDEAQAEIARRLAPQTIQGSAPPSPVYAPPTGPVSQPITPAPPVQESATAQRLRQALSGDESPPSAARPTPPPGAPSGGAPFGTLPSRDASAMPRNGPTQPLRALVRDSHLGRGERWVDPTTYTPVQLTGTMMKSLADVKPEVIKGFTPGVDVIPRPGTEFTQHLAALTEQGTLFNDRPSTRLDGTPEQKAAGRNWVRLMRERIQAHGVPEVERLVREYQAQHGIKYYEDIAQKRGYAAYWEDRANAIIEAAQKAEAAGAMVPAFTLKRGGRKFPFIPSTGAPRTTPIEAPVVDRPTAERIAADPIGSTVAHINPANGGAYRNLIDRLTSIVESPDGFGPSMAARRRPLYIPPQRGAEPAWAKPNSPEARRWPEALERYNAVYDLHQQTQRSRGLAPPPPTPQVAPPPPTPVSTPATPAAGLPATPTPVAGTVGKRSIFQRSKLPGTTLSTLDLTTTTEADPRVQNLALDPHTIGLMLNPIELGGRTTTIFDLNWQANREVDELHNLAVDKAKADAAGEMFDAAAEARLKALTKQFADYEPRIDWADDAIATTLPDGTTIKHIEPELARIASLHTLRQFEAARYPKTAVKARGMVGNAVQLVDDLTAANRSLRLTSAFTAPQQFARQLFGNIMTGLIAAPEAAVEVFKPGRWKGVYKSARSVGEYSRYGDMLQARRGSVPRTLDTRNKSLAGYATSIENPLVRKFRDVLTWKPLADMVQVPDAVAREGLHKVHYADKMKQELRAAPDMAVEVWGAYHKKGNLPAIAPDEVKRVVADTIAAHKHTGEPISRATGQDLKNALIKAFEGRPSGATTDAADAKKALHDFADRVGRNLAEADNTLFYAANKKVNDVYLSWESTNADEAANHILLYTYWASRTSGVYAKAMLRKPWMAAAMMRLTEQVQAEAEAGNYPEWMKGYTRILNSPAGLTLLVNPLDAVSTMFVLGDWQYGQDATEAMTGDLTALGALRGVLPAVVASPFDFLLWATGAYGGEDARMPYNLTGATPTTRRFIQIVNAAGYAGLLPFGMGRDAQGNFHPFNETPLEDLAMKLGVMFGRPPMDLTASQDVRVEQHLQQILIEQHPEWETDPNGADLLNEAVNTMKNDAAAGIYSDEWLDAEQTAVGDSLTGPDFPGLPEPLRGLVGGAIRALSPLRIMSEPEIKTQLRAGDLPVGIEDGYDTGRLKGGVYDTLGVANLKAHNTEWWEIGTDTGAAEAYRTYHTIGQGELAAPITIYDTTYTQSDLDLMSEAQRYDVASTYLASQGYTPSDLDAYKAAREEMEAAHPDLAAYHDFTEYTKDYPGGLTGFVDAAVISSPSYARYMAQLPYPPGSPEYYAAGDSAEAFYALEGKRTSVYDPTVLPDAGTIPGQPPGYTFAVRQALQSNADATAESTTGDGNAYTDFVAGVQKDVDALYNAQNLLNAMYPGSGLRAGVDYIPTDMYYTLKDAGYYTPDKGNIAYEYNDWLLGNATSVDTSVEAFLDQRDRPSETAGVTTAKQENVTPEQIIAQHGGNVEVIDPSVPRTDTGEIDTTDLPWVKMNQQMPVYSTPNAAGETGLILYPEMRVRLVQQSADGTWAQIIMPGGEVGWMWTVALNTVPA